MLVTHVGICGHVLVIPDVEVSALPRWHGMRTGQNESRGRVIELAICPGHSVMTLLAGCGEAGMRYRRGRRVVVGLMATDAGGRWDEGRVGKESGCGRARW